MHLLACLDSPSSGKITFDGEDVTTFSQGKLNRFRNETFGFVFQQFFLNGRDTVLENVVLPLKIRGLSAAERRAKALDYLRAVGLEDKAGKQAKDLSGGEKQRVCIARALASEPKVIFADEPTGNLDSVTGALVEETLFRLNREQGIAVVIVTHDDELAAKCDRRIELKDGEII
jgi:putative ABC transport system ATP-binding protein